MLKEVVCHRPDLTGNPKSIGLFQDFREEKS